MDSGPNRDRWNLVILGDGYRNFETARYHTDVQNFVATLHATPPFERLWRGINIHRVDVVSKDNGADDPTDCPDVAGSGAKARTFFDATFCSVGPGNIRLSRLLTVDANHALAVATASVPEVHQVLVIVNAGKYGGSGGRIAVCSTHPSAAQIAIHEIGHSAFSLGDEYGGNGSGSPTGEPGQPNVTRDPRAATKWHALIAPTTPMPTACDPNCRDCKPPAVRPAPGAVGTYEGGMYSDCGVFRPLPDCKMRTLTAPFCPVCAKAIRDTLSVFQPAELIAAITPVTPVSRPTA